MPETAKVPAEDGLKVTITIAEKAARPSAKGVNETATDAEPDTFVIDNGKKILTITIAE